MSTDLLFVYGTLKEGAEGAVAVLLRDRAEYVGRGTIRGTLYDLGEYPGAVEPERPGDRVHGSLYRLAEPLEILPVLDEYEECESNDPASLFRRVRRPVTMEDGTRRIAWVYLYNHPTEGESRVPSGEYQPSG